MHGVTLTAGAPRQELAIAAPGAAPGTLALTIAAIDNPSSQAFSLSADVTWSKAGGAAAAAVEEPVGRVTPFPANRPGSFLLAVPDAARKLLSRCGGQLSLRLALQPIAADRALAEPLRVTIAEPAWR